MAKFTYKFTGDSDKIFRGRLVKPGDLVDADDEVINGDFEPANPAAKTAKAATEKAEKDRAAVFETERAAAMDGSLPFAPALQAPTSPSSIPAAAPAAPAEA